MAAPTTLDHMNGMMYAIDRLKKEKCNNKQIKDKYKDAIIWEPREEKRSYSCSLPDTTGSAFELPECEHGKCRIQSADLCAEQSTYPYNEDGTLKSNKKCKTDDDCKNLPFTAMCGSTDPKTCIPSQPYLEYKIDPNNPQNNICTYGNIALKKWCEDPSSRNDSAVNGQTNVPPFKYDPTKSQCSMTPAYCKWMNVDYQETPPDCKRGGGQAFAEDWLLGKTIFRGIKQFIHGFESHVTKLADDRYVQSKKIVGKDFGGKGVHLYFIVWKPTAKKIDKTCEKPNVSFLASDVRKKFPEIVQKKNGNDFIHIDKEDVLKNPELKRIAAICRSTNWLGETFLHLHQQHSKA
jgi:hypothetical protein